MKHAFKKWLAGLLSLVLAATALCACNININIGGGDSGVRKLIVHFLDIGQGDSIFAELPNGRTMLVDAGDNYYGAGIISYIEAAGYSKIDYLVATHPHADHIGSMPYIVRNFDIGSMYMPNVSANTTTFESLIKSMKSKGIKAKSGRAGMNMFNEDGLSADIIAPYTIDEDNLNNCSLVIKLTFGSRSFLLTGDAETGEMKEIKTDLHADVLKAGHHGSRTSLSQTLLQSIDPDVTVISCGVDNDYNHPHAEVLQMLKGQGCTIYRTDRDKTVIVSTDGTALTVSTGNPSIKREN